MVWNCGYIGYCLFFACVCTVTDFSAEDKASGVKFCTAVHRRPIKYDREYPILVNFSPPEAQIQNRPANRPTINKK